MHRCRLHSSGTPLRAMERRATMPTTSRFQFLSAKTLLLVINMDEADVAAVAQRGARR